MIVQRVWYADLHQWLLRFSFLVFRLCGPLGIELVLVNAPVADAATEYHLLNLDFALRRWHSGIFSIAHGVRVLSSGVTCSSETDPRRVRSGLTSSIPTITCSAKAIAMIFPEFKGRLNGHAVPVPLLNGLLTDAVFELKQSVTVEHVITASKASSEGPLQRILGYEERPLVSCDYTNDNRSSIVDALSTMVVDGNQLKVFALYDNEWGYSCRMAHLTCHVVGLEA